ncbi:hypothetical protein N7510_002431 [Penicillium lagena]|uniref:uncharacterized protein n=1 Tax=Penicillium lagena TaxID=94218 RepID=UPI002541B752|nr:uncharacterized protein N7510_002431 [Penicillium lagena]KAJ5626122.1 hypothetical protein N7510_002431 [Penicillium lagena]
MVLFLTRVKYGGLVPRTFGRKLSATTASGDHCSIAQERKSLEWRLTCMGQGEARKFRPKGKGYDRVLLTLGARKTIRGPSAGMPTRGLTDYFFFDSGMVPTVNRSHDGRRSSRFRQSNPIPRDGGAAISVREFRPAPDMHEA